MKRFLSLTVTLLLLYAMLLAAIPASAVIAGPYAYEVGCIQSIENVGSKVLGRGKATYYQSKVTSLMQNEADRVQTYNTHVVVGTSEAKFFVYSAEAANKMGYGLKTALEIAKDFEKANPDYQVIAAVNGDFFNTSTGEPESPMIQNGNLLKTYVHEDMIGRGVVGIDDTTGKVVYHTIGDAYKKAGFGTDFNYDGEYHVQVLNADKTDVDASYPASLAAAPTAEQISFTTADYNGGAYEGKTVYVVELEEYRRDRGTHNKDIYTNEHFYAYGKIVEVKDGTANMKPEAGKVYIAVENNTQAPKLVVGAYVKCQKVLTGDWANVSNALGFKQQLIANGVIIFENTYSRYHHSLAGGSSSGYGEKADYYCNCGASKTETEKWTEDLYDYPMCWKHRTAIGFKADGSCVLMTVARSEGDGWGATYVELANQLMALGCKNAFLLDGGGSSTMVIRQGDELTTVFAGENGTTGRVVANVAILAVPKEAPLNTADITEAIAKAEAMKKDDYTASDKAWSSLTSAIEDAKTILADETASQEYIDIVCASLVSAINDVEKTKKPAETEGTEAPATEDNKNDVEEPAVDNSGCGSSISLAAIVTVGAIGATAIVKKKRKK